MNKCKIFNSSNTYNLENDMNSWFSKSDIKILSVTQSSTVWSGDIKTIITIIYEEKHLPQDTGPR